MSEKASSPTGLIPLSYTGRRQAPTQYELIINVKTAKAPRNERLSMSALADESDMELNTAHRSLTLSGPGHSIISVTRWLLASGL